MSQITEKGLWTMYGTVNIKTYDEFKRLGLMPQIHQIIENAMKEAISKKKGSK